MRISAPMSIALAALVLGLGGCGPSEVSRSELIPVKGKVTYKGKPLAAGIVTFEPVSAGRSASGDIQPDGTFVLKTFKDGDGVVPGAHKVSVGSAGAKTPRDFPPTKYASPNTSNLEADVSKDRTEFTFDIK